MVKSFEGIQPVPFGSYQLVERLAMGGMAEVYLARPDGQQRFVALKRILPNIAADDEFIAMFIDEAKIAGQLNHPNIAQIFDLGKINNSYFIAMEYVSGHDLRALWDRTRDAGDGGKTALPIGLACYIVKRICDGLDFAHRRRDSKGRPLGIIHRDVSPQNILVSYDGDLKIIDFGIAKAANRLVKTQTGILKGKFAYMAPEQARGEPTDHRADIFAIGVILYELLTGERAFKAESDFALLEKVRRVDLPAPRSLRPELPKDIERIVSKALAKEAADRYAWASALGADLDRFITDQGYASSKEELGGYLQRTFKEELKEEKKRLAAYRAIFDDDDDDDDEPQSATQMRGERRGGHVSLDPAEPGDGTAMGDSVDDGESSVATSFEEGPPTHAAQNNGASLRTGSEDDDDIDASEEASAVGAAVPRAKGMNGNGRPSPATGSQGKARPSGKAAQGGQSGQQARDARAATARAVDETQMEPDTLPPPEPEPVEPISKSVSRDEVPRKGRVSARSAGAPADTDKSLERPSKGPSLDAPVLSSQSGERVPAGDRERDASRSNTDRVAGRERPFERSERSSFSRGGASAPAPAPASIAPVLIAAFLGSIIGAGVVGIAWLASAKPTSSVVFVTTPRQTEVRLGDVVLCQQTPCTAPLPPGKHELRFRAPGAEELSRTVEVKADGIPVNVEVVLERTRDVRLETTPPGATVTMNDRVIGGTTPLTLPKLVVGEAMRLKLQRDGFEPLEIVRVVEDGDEVWRYELPTSTTTWAVTADPPDALIEGPGKMVGAKLITSVTTKKSVQVRFQRPGCADRTVTLQATGRAEAEQKVVLECKKRDGGLYVNGRRGLQVRIDGIEIPRWASLKPYPLPAGTWVVNLRGARGKTEQHNVEVLTGQFPQLVTKLK